jgi:hypothetical protein
VELSWLAYETVATLLEDSGERILPETRQLVDVNAVAEEAAKPGFHLSLPDYLTRTGKGWTENAEIFRKINEKYEFDLVVGDEAYELVLARLQGEFSIKPTFLSIYDLSGLEPMGRNPIERFLCYLAVRKFVKPVPKEVLTYAYVGEVEAPQRPSSQR